MFCSVYRWLISRALDSGTPYSERARHHLKNCPECLEFSRRLESLHERLAQEAREFAASPQAGLNERILTALPSRPKPASPGSRPRSLRPAFAAALGVLVIALCMIFVVTRDTPLRPQSETGSFKFLDFEKVPAPPISQSSLRNLTRLAESPISREMENLKQDVNTLVAFLLSRLDMGSLVGPQKK